jgi:hypothetical protein
MTPDTKRAPAKKPFDIDEVMARMREAVEHYPKAVLFELAERGYGSPCKFSSHASGGLLQTRPS